METFNRTIVTVNQGFDPGTEQHGSNIIRKSLTCTRQLSSEVYLLSTQANHDCRSKNSNNTEEAHHVGLCVMCEQSPDV